MQVSQNCEYTLRQATWYGFPHRRRHYWVDAICINQNSNEEKGPQVAHMGEIYTNAERVLACVGESTADSRFLYRRLRMDTEYYRNARYVRDGKADPVVSLRKPSPETMDRIFRALRDFLERPYFSRLWVYQELFLGKQIIVCCGKQHVSAHVLHGLVVTNLSRFVREGIPGAIVHPYSHYTPGSSLVLEVGVLNLAPTTLTAALRNAQNLACTDPRDRIFGVLSTINGPDKNPIRPDYAKDRLEIAIDVLKIVDEENQSVGHPRMEVVDDILDTLDLFDRPSTQLKEAVQRRWLGSPTQLANRYQRNCRNPYRYKGWRLAYKNGRWTLEGFARGLYEKPISVRRQSNCVKSPSLKHGLLLPPVTCPGDWCIANWQYPALIARPLFDGHFDIVGKALSSLDKQDFDMHFLAAKFDVYFGFEDIMVLRETLNMCYSSDVSDDGITEYLGTKVCSQAGSSYAIKVSHWP